MYTLAYVTRNMSLGFLKVENFASCITIPEDLVFVGIRIMNETIFNPDNIMSFTDVERLIIGLRGSFDLSFLKDSDFRKQNSKMCPVPLIIPIDLTGITFTFGEGVAFQLPEGAVNPDYTFNIQYCLTTMGVSWQSDGLYLEFNDTTLLWEGYCLQEVKLIRIYNSDLNEYTIPITVPYPIPV